MPFRSCALALLVALAPAAAQTTRPAAVPVAPTEAQQINELIRNGRLDAALKRADDFLAKRPRDAQIRFLRGVIFSDMGKTNEAIGVFEALIQDYPELPEPYNNLAVIYAGQGRYEQARTLLTRALQAQPNYVTAYENLGDLYLSMAADAYERGTKLDAANQALKTKLALAREVSAKLRTTP